MRWLSRMVSTAVIRMPRACVTWPTWAGLSLLRVMSLPGARTVGRGASVGRAAAGQVVDRGRRVGQLRTNEVADEAGHLNRLAHPAHGNLGEQGAEKGRIDTLAVEDLGLDHRRGDGVDENARGRQLLTERLGQADDGGLAR